MNYLSFFSGAMGLDQGLEKAGFTPRLMCEFDKCSRATINANRPDVPLIDDINNYDSDEVLKHAGLKAKDVFLIAGGPPCQSFSTAGKRRAFSDSRGNAFLKFLEICIAISPKYILIENVRGLLSAPLNPQSEDPSERKKGAAIRHIVELLEENGYLIEFELYNAANFGVPQKRERVILIATLSTLSKNKVPKLTPTHTEQEGGKYDELLCWETLRDVLPCGEVLPSGEDASGDEYDDEAEYLPFPEKRLAYYRLIKEGQNWRSLPVALQKEALGGAYESGGGKSGFLRRLSWNKPSPTLLTSPKMPATDLAHPTLDRPLSVQEYKRIQQFPDDFEICGATKDKYKQLGNAVPVGLGYAAGLAILNHHRGPGLDDHGFEDFPHSRYKNTDYNYHSALWKREE